MSDHDDAGVTERPCALRRFIRRRIVDHVDAHALGRVTQTPKQEKAWARFFAKQAKTSAKGATANLNDTVAVVLRHTDSATATA